MHTLLPPPPKQARGHVCRTVPSWAAGVPFPGRLQRPSSSPQPWLRCVCVSWLACRESASRVNLGCPSRAPVGAGWCKRVGRSGRNGCVSCTLRRRWYHGSVCIRQTVTRMEQEGWGEHDGSLGAAATRTTCPNESGVMSWKRSAQSAHRASKKKRGDCGYELNRSRDASSGPTASSPCRRLPSLQRPPRLTTSQANFTVYCYREHTIMLSSATGLSLPLRVRSGRRVFERNGEK